MSPKHDDELNLERADFDGDAAVADKGAAEPFATAHGAASLAEAQSTNALPPRSCAACQRRIIDRYFEVNTQTLCPRCAAIIQEQHEHGLPGAFTRAVLYGAAGGVLGAALYYGVLLVAKAEFGIIAIAVGILVGKGVRRGAGLHRHWLYPALGIGITYLAITSTYVPEVLRALQAAEGAAEDAAMGPLTVSTVLAAWLFAMVVPALMLAQLQLWGPIILAIGLWEGWRYGRSPKLAFKGPIGSGESPATGVTAPAP